MIGDRDVTRLGGKKVSRREILTTVTRSDSFSRRGEGARTEEGESAAFIGGDVR